MRRSLVILMAVACGATVANLYYAQPLLDTLAHDLGVSEATAGLLVTASQLGYAAGLVLLVPLGDLLDRRWLIAVMLAITAVALAACAAAPTFPALAAALVVVGVTSVVSQILVPFASLLADEDERGRVVGIVMSGLLIGILLARTVSGFVTELGGWRLVFGLAAGGMVVLGLVLWRALPDVRQPATLPYPRLLRSVLTLVRTEPLLRRRMRYGALGMSSFTVLWTAIAFLLAGAPYHYSDLTIGLFGLVGVTGAVAAQAAGRLADAGHGHAATGAFAAALLASWGFLALGGTSVVALIVGILLLDLGVQGVHITNQTVIYSLAPEARSRLTTAYMTGNFLAGAAASALTAVAWSVDRWDGVLVLGGALGLLMVGLWIAERRPAREPLGLEQPSAGG